MRFLWFFVMILGMAHGKENVEFDASESTIFSASINCSPTYTVASQIECKFYLKNNGQQDYSVLKWRTPLDQFLSDCLTFTYNTKKLQYDGIYMKRSNPGPHQYLPVRAGQTVSSTFHMSDAYDVTKPGGYSIAVNTYLEYVVGSLPGKPLIKRNIIHLFSPAIHFQIVGRGSSKGTLGQRARSLDGGNLFTEKSFLKGILGIDLFGKRGQSLTAPKNHPIVKRGSRAQRKATKVAHGAAFKYMKSAIPDLENNHQRVTTWFGTSHVSDATKVFKQMGEILQKYKITYIFGGKHCDSETYAYTFKGTRKIYLCKRYARAKTLSGFDNKMGIITHELSHALTHTDDKVYGQSACKQLAKKASRVAVKNADNYEYFVETLALSI